MSWFRRTLGLDGFDLVLHVGVTLLLMVWVSMSGGPEELFPVITGISLIVLGIRRSLAIRKAGHPGLTTGEMAAERIAELEQRVAELESVHMHVADLAERLDFTERLLAQAPPALKVMGPAEPR